MRRCLKVGGQEASEELAVADNASEFVACVNDENRADVMAREDSRLLLAGSSVRSVSRGLARLRAFVSHPSLGRGRRHCAAPLRLGKMKSRG